MELYCKHVRKRFLSCSESEDAKVKDPENGALPFFLSSNGVKVKTVRPAVEWFKKQFVEAGTHTAEELKYLSGKDFRSCISSWASDHVNDNVRLNAPALQNHSAAIHETIYRKNKLRQAMGQSLALQRDLSKLAGNASDSEVLNGILFC